MTGKISPPDRIVDAGAADEHAVSAEPQEHEGEPQATEGGGSAGAQEADYRVGYARPPVASRFQPGRSGNPKGRTKNSRNLKSVVAAALAETVTVREGDRTRRMTKAEAAVQANLMKAAKGDTRAFTALIALAARAGVLDLAPEAAGDMGALAPDDQAIIDAYLARLVGEGSR